MVDSNHNCPLQSTRILNLISTNFKQRAIPVFPLLYRFVSFILLVLNRLSLLRDVHMTMVPEGTYQAI